MSESVSLAAGPRAVVVTALPVEYAAVRAHLKSLVEDEHPEGDVYERGQFDDGKRQWQVGIVEIGAGNPNAAQKTERVLNHFKPDVILFVGVAGGIKDAKIGDLVVATKVYGYPSGKADSEFKPRPEVGLPQHRILERARAEARKPDWLKRLGTPPDPLPQVFLGPIAAGEQVVTSTLSESYKLIRGNYNDALAVEMEGYGFLKAVQAHSSLDALVVRGISDLLEGKAAADQGGSQPRASNHAAAFAFEVLAKLTLPDKVPRIEIREVVHRGAAPLAAPVRSTLPNQPYFFGRVEELKIVAEALAPESRTWGALIDGPGGIGKTALAVRAAYLAPAEWFERKIFITAKVRDLTPEGEKPLTDFTRPTYLAMLDELGSELGEEGLERIAPEERTNVLRLALMGKKVLIIFDNLETLPKDERTRLYQFLGRIPEGNKAIITSRRRTDVDARLVRLDRLTRDASLQLIAELAKKYPPLDRAAIDDRDKLYAISHGNPLLIRWIAGQLGRETSRCRTIDEAIAFLNLVPKDNDPLEYIFGDLLDTFTTDETKVLAALTHFTQPAKLLWLVMMTELPNRAIETALEDLTDRAILTSDPDASLWLLPPLASLFVRTRRQTAVHQTGNALLDRAYALVVQYGGLGDYAGYRYLEKEWGLLSAALPRFLMRNDDQLHEVCAALSQVLVFTGRWDEGLWFFEQAESCARAANDPRHAHERAYDVGFLFNLRGQAAEVHACADRLDNYQLDGNLALDGIGARLRGMGHRLDGNFPAAIANFSIALAIQRSLHRPRGILVLLLDLGSTERKNKNFHAAEMHLREALEGAEKVVDLEAIASCSCRLAELALDRERWGEAESLARKSLELSEHIGRQEMIGTACHRLAEAILNQHRLSEEGRNLARRAVDVLTPLRYRDLHEAQKTLEEIERAMSAQ